MRVCRSCQAINGDTDVTCRMCGTRIGNQVILPPYTPVPRPLPHALTRRNRGYMILMLLLPLITAMVIWFWVDFVPSIFHEVHEERNRLLLARQAQLHAALQQCAADTGGVPATRLAVLQQFSVTAKDLTPGAHPARWKGPYLPAASPFPANPYRPNDGAAGWHYQVRGAQATVTPAHLNP